LKRGRYRAPRADSSLDLRFILFLPGFQAWERRDGLALFALAKAG
jgi:hypothetical protein